MGANRMRYHIVHRRLLETQVDDSTNLLVSLRNQNAMRQTRMDSNFGTITNKPEEEDSDDDDEGTTIDNADCTDEE